METFKTFKLLAKQQMSDWSVEASKKIPSLVSDYKILQKKPILLMMSSLLLDLRTLIKPNLMTVQSEPVEQTEIVDYPNEPKEIELSPKEEISILEQQLVKDYNNNELGDVMNKEKRVQVLKNDIFRSNLRKIILEPEQEKDLKLAYFVGDTDDKIYYDNGDKGYECKICGTIVYSIDSLEGHTECKKHICELVNKKSKKHTVIAKRSIPKISTDIKTKYNLTEDSIICNQCGYKIPRLNGNGNPRNPEVQMKRHLQHIIHSARLELLEKNVYVDETYLKLYVQEKQRELRAIKKLPKNNEPKVELKVEPNE